MAKRVQVYVTRTCPYCHAAKNLLREKSVDFEEIDVTDSPELREKLVGMCHGRTTVPAIVVDGKCLGGYEELAEHYRQGKKI
jgi:glutaredoxin 3